MRISESEKVEVNGHTIVITRNTKYSYIATDDKGQRVASDKSKPKVIVKVSELLPLTKVKVIAKRKVSIKSVVLDSIIADMTDGEIVSKVTSDFPDSKFDKKHMAWYRSTLARDGVISHEFAPKYGKLHKAWKEANK